MKYHPENGCHLRVSGVKMKPHGLCNRVSLTGAVAFEKVTKVRIRQVHLDSDPKWSVRTYTCQTVRMTIRAEIEAG